MSWSGPLLGVSAVLALGGALGAALLPRARWMLASMAVAMIGVCGACVAAGAGFVAVCVLASMAVMAPLALLASVAMAPPAEPDRRAGARSVLAPLAGVAAFLLLALVLTKTVWPPAGGPMQLSPEWLGSRLLIDHAFTLVLMAAVLSLAGVGSVALLRPRRPR